MDMCSCGYKHKRVEYSMVYRANKDALLTEPQGAVPVAPQWTQERPTKPGWYFRYYPDQQEYGSKFYNALEIELLRQDVDYGYWMPATVPEPPSAAGADVNQMSVQDAVEDESQ